MGVIPNRFASTSDFVAWLAAQRNDMQETAIAISPRIGQVLAALTQNDACRLARMSGSGATCFGLYDTQAAAQHAADSLAQSHPDWWVQPCTLGEANP